MDDRPSGRAGGGPDDLTTLIDQIDPVRLGRRLRHARKAAGLTQEQLGGDAYSAPYVSRIEDGHRRATPAFVAHLGRQLGLPPVHLVSGLDPEVRARIMADLDHGELLLSSSDSSPAATTADLALHHLDGLDAPDLTRRALRLRAAVREAAGELRSAAEDLELIVEPPRPDLAWVVDLTSLNRCYRDGGQVDRAIALDQRYGAEIVRLGLDRSNEAIKFSVSIAGALLQRGDLAHALRICRRCITRAEEAGLADARASALWNQSVIVQMTGDLAHAIDLAEEALAAFEASDDLRNLGRLRHHVADLKLAITPPDPDGALALLDQVATEIDWSRAGSLALGKQRLSEARAARLAGDRARAQRALAESVALVGPDSISTLADHQRLLGQLAFDDDDSDRARAHYANAVALLTSVGADVDVSEVWFELGGALEAAGEHRLALEAYRSAGATRGMRSAPRDLPD